MRTSKDQNEHELVVAFDSTASALAFADAARAAGLKGRLFPIPRTLSAGCGIAWRDCVSVQETVENIIAAEEIDDARIVIMALKL